MGLNFFRDEIRTGVNEKLEGAELPGRAPSKPQRGTPPSRRGAAFDGETGFASGEIVAMDGLVVFEKIEETGSKLFARRIFLNRLATFWGIAPSNLRERCRFFCGF